MVGPERPTVYKLLAEEVLVPDVKAAEDLNLRAASDRARRPENPDAVPRASSAAEPDFRRTDCVFRWIQAARANQTSRHGESRSESWPVWPEST